MKIKILDKKTNIVYTNDMNLKNRHCILSIEFCSQYTKVQVQDEVCNEEGVFFEVSYLLVEPYESISNFKDLMISEGYNEGKFINN